MSASLPTPTPKQDIWPTSPTYTKATHFHRLPANRGATSSECDALAMTQKATSTAKVAAALGPWLVKHREGVSKPLIDDFLTGIRNSPGQPKVGVIGFCWGGRYAILAAHGNLVDASYAYHPSLVSVPADFDAVKEPMSLALGTQDSLLGMKEVEQIKELMEKKQMQSKVKLYEDQVYGFVLRGDWSSEKDKKAMDDAEKQGLEWFGKHLG